MLILLSQLEINLWNLGSSTELSKFIWSQLWFFFSSTIQFMFLCVTKQAIGRQLSLLSQSNPNLTSVGERLEAGRTLDHCESAQWLLQYFITYSVSRLHNSAYSDFHYEWAMRQQTQVQESWYATRWKEPGFGTRRLLIRLVQLV